MNPSERRSGSRTIASFAHVRTSSPRVDPFPSVDRFSSEPVLNGGPIPKCGQVLK